MDTVHILGTSVSYSHFILLQKEDHEEIRGKLVSQNLLLPMSTKLKTIRLSLQLMNQLTKIE